MATGIKQGLNGVFTLIFFIMMWVDFLSCNACHGLLITLSFYCVRSITLTIFFTTIKIQWKNIIDAIWLLANRSLQFFAYAKSAQLSCHMQNWVVITSSEFGWGKMKFPLNFNCNVKLLVEWTPVWIQSITILVHSIGCSHDSYYSFNLFPMCTNRLFPEF